MASARHWIDRLGLEPHPEGGYYRETYRSRATLSSGAAVASVIYYLLESDDVSVMHRLDSDEMWHHYAGSALTLHVIDPKGGYTAKVLGPECRPGMEPQAVVPAGHWFGATVNDSASFALVGCTVAPAFEFEKFELGSRAKLTRLYPEHRHIIEKLTR